jgi:hypothetical protein
MNYNISTLIISFCGYGYSRRETVKQCISRCQRLTSLTLTGGDRIWSSTDQLIGVFDCDNILIELSLTWFLDINAINLSKIVYLCPQLTYLKLKKCGRNISETVKELRMFLDDEVSTPLVPRKHHVRIIYATPECN